MNFNKDKKLATTASPSCLVGYALNAKKLRKSDNNNHAKKIWSGGGLADILTEEIEDGVAFKSFDFDLPLEEQPSYHVILHKITEDIRRRNDPESQRKVQFLQRYLELHPKTKIIDPINDVEKVITRSRVCSVLDSMILPSRLSSGNHNTCNNSFELFSQPKYLIVTQQDKIQEIFSQSTLRFPVICKPIEACGTPNSHSMVVAMALDGLLLVESPCIIQEYWDHSASFYKVYVIDNDVMVYRRPSLPDIQQLSQTHALRSLIFDSRYAYPTLEDFVIPDDSSILSQTLSHLSLHTPVDSNDISPIPFDLSLLTGAGPSLHEVLPDCYPLSSYPSSVSSSCLDMEFHYPFDDFTADLLPSCSGGYVHHTPHRGLKPGASPSHKFQRPTASSQETKQSSPIATSTSAAVTAGRISEQVTCHNERFKDIACQLKNGFGLSLFGFDVLIPNNPQLSSLSSANREEQFLIIDVNFFPSYKEVHDFPARLRTMLRNKSSASSSPAASPCSPL